jgi:magnesium and cobalt exporter, CNNM family
MIGEPPPGDGVLRNPETVRRKIIESHHSRLPVHDGNPDDVIGVVQAKDLLDVCLRGELADIRAHLKSAPVIPDSIDALDVVVSMRQSPVHMALVHDEYRNFEGIVTTADLLESILGAFKTDEGPVAPDAVQRGDGSWLVSGSMPADEMGERLSIGIPKERSYHTAAGFVLDQVGHLPDVGETFDAQGWRFEIVDLDGRRIDKILASRILSGRRASSPSLGRERVGR